MSIRAPCPGRKTTKAKTRPEHNILPLLPGADAICGRGLQRRSVKNGKVSALGIFNGKNYDQKEKKYLLFPRNGVNILYCIEVCKYAILFLDT